MEKIRAVRGMPDILPPNSERWAAVEARLSGILDAYGYREIRMPLVESTQLFSRSIGEVTDIVEKEMYTFGDRKNRSLTLRPEGTAGCVRAAIENGLLDVPQKLWYCGPMFRYENPQKGRQRQFHQIGAEALGFGGIEVEIETLLLQRKFWQQLGLQEHVTLQLNTIGNSASRQAYKNALIEYLEQFRNDLDGDSQRRLAENPLRILDSKVPRTQEILQAAPELDAFLDHESAGRFEKLQDALSALGIEFYRNKRLVRGLDYYNDTVFEWVSGLLGAQATVCAGGRYDGLVEQLGGRAQPAFGFAIGLERLLLILENLDDVGLELKEAVDVYFVVSESDFQQRAFVISEQVRQLLPEKILYQQLVAGSMKSQFKRADKLKARYVLILGEDEFRSNKLTIKNMANGEQASVDLSAGYEPLISALDC